MKDYRQIAFSMVEIVRYIDDRYSGCISREEASKPIMKSNDETLKSMYKNFRNVW